MGDGVLGHVTPEVQDKFEAYLKTTAEFGGSAPDESGGESLRMAQSSEAQPPGQLRIVEDEELPRQEAPAAEGEEEVLEEEEPAAAAGEEGEEEGEGEAFNTFAEFAETYEVEPEVLENHIMVEGRADEGMIPLSQALEGYRNQAYKSAGMSAEIVDLRKEMTERSDVVMKDLTMMASMLHDKIVGNHKSDDYWKQLKASDLQQYVTEREQQQADMGDMNAALQSMEARNKDQEEENERGRKAFVEQEAEAIFGLHPKWRAKKEGEAAFGEIGGLLDSYQFSPEEKAQAVDHRYLDIIWKAAQWDKMKGNQTDVLRKKLSRVPRKTVLASARGEQKNQKEVQQSEYQGARDRFRKSGDIKSADAAIAFERFLQ